MSTTLQIQGVIQEIKPLQTITETFSKREFTIQLEDGKYPQVCQFQCTGNNIAKLDELGTGDEVKVDFNLRGREWTSPKDGEVKVFNSLEAWRFEVVSKSATAQGEGDAEGEDLPF